MKRIIYKNDKEEEERLALHFFLRGSGLFREGDQFEKMRKQAFAIKDEIKNHINPRGLVCCFEGFELRNDSLFVEGIEFKCNPFSLINPKAIKGICLYVLASREYDQKDKDLMDQLYADLWGTAYLDAGRKIIGDNILEDFPKNEDKTEQIIVSQSFGPGFYGMDTDDLKKIIELTNASEIGVEWLDDGMMLPVKSCAGIFFIVGAGTTLPGSGCETCLGSRYHCNMCSVGG